MPDAHPPHPHHHVFLGQEHDTAERRTWTVIALCLAMMTLEIVGGLVFGSIALVADGLHMSTHAGALLLAALAYRYARRLASDPRFTFGTGKLGDLAGFTSAIVLAMIALLIGYESLTRLFAPIPIAFAEAIPIACLGLAVNIASVWLLGGGHHGHSHAHGHGHAHDEPPRTIQIGTATLTLEVFEDGVPPRFRLRGLPPGITTIETIRPGGACQSFALIQRPGYLESAEAIPEPHAFTARITSGTETATLEFEEHDHAPQAGKLHRDNNMRAAIVHVIADAAVSVLVIAGLLLARAFGWLWLDPAAGLVGAAVIASWAYGLVRDTGAILLDMNPDRALSDTLRDEIETGGDRLIDLHLWRLGPGHLGAVLAITTPSARCPADYRARLARFTTLSHVTIEVERA